MPNDPEEPAGLVKPSAIVAGTSKWENVYRMLPPAQIPWNAGGPDENLVKLVDAGTIPVGPALDLGCGLGHDAIFLAQKGFPVIAIDIAAGAVKLASENAEKAAIKDKIDFRTGDILESRLEKGSSTLINDRGLFHFLPKKSRAAYLDFVTGTLAPGGLLHLRVFSDKEPPGLTPPFRFSWKQLKEIFGERLDFVDGSEGVFAGPAKPRAYVCLLKKV